MRDRSIYTVKPNGGGLRRLTYGAADGSPTWRPNGKRIAFVRQSQIRR
jgi:Tol biopolymer transport system component